MVFEWLGGTTYPGAVLLILRPYSFSFREKSDRCHKSEGWTWNVLIMNYVCQRYKPLLQYYNLRKLSQKFKWRNVRNFVWILWISRMNSSGFTAVTLIITLIILNKVNICYICFLFFRVKFLSMSYRWFVFSYISREEEWY